MRNKIFYYSAACLAVIAGVLFNSIQENTNQHILADVVLTTVNQTAYPLSQHQGKIVVLNFWATWCPPCIEEMPELSSLYENKLKKQNIEMIGIAIDNANNIQNFLDKTPVKYPILIGGFNGTTFAKKLGNKEGGLPFTVIINAQGDVILKKAGRIYSEDILNALKKP